MNSKLNRFPVSLLLVALLVPIASFAQGRPSGEKQTAPRTDQDPPAKQQPSPETPKPVEPKKPESGQGPDEQRPEGEAGPRDPMSTPTFNGLRLRSIGPAFTSGRISGIAVDPNNAARYFVSAASGGVWKTVNAGITWTPVFDREGSYSIGCIVLDPKNPLTVWVGTGENNSQRSVSYGNGVYRSDDGGKSWKNVGRSIRKTRTSFMSQPRDLCGDRAVIGASTKPPMAARPGNRF